MSKRLAADEVRGILSGRTTVREADAAMRAENARLREALEHEIEHLDAIRLSAEQESIRLGADGDHLGEYEAKGIESTARRAGSRLFELLTQQPPTQPPPNVLSAAEARHAGQCLLAEAARYQAEVRPEIEALGTRLINPPPTDDALSVPDQSQAGDLARHILDALDRPADDPSDQESLYMQRRIEAAIKGWFQEEEGDKQPVVVLLQRTDGPPRETPSERVERLEAELVEAEAAVERKRQEDGP